MHITIILIFWRCYISALTITLNIAFTLSTVILAIFVKKLYKQLQIFYF